MRDSRTPERLGGIEAALAEPLSEELTAARDDALDYVKALGDGARAVPACVTASSSSELLRDYYAQVRSPGFSQHSAQSGIEAATGIEPVCAALQAAA